jgi:acyl-CoA dehydrogenase
MLARGGGRTGVKFEFSEEQEELRAQARRLLREKCPSTVIRRVFDGMASHDETLWGLICDLGWTAVAIPAEHGGLGLGKLEACVIAEELGRALAPVPYLSSAIIFSDALLLAGDQEQRDKWLPEIASGGAIGALALAEGAGVTAWSRSKVAASSIAGRDAALTGVKWPVVDAGCADVALVSAASPGGVSLYLVDLRQSGVSIEPIPSLDQSRPLSRITLTGARGQRLAGGADLIDAVLDQAAVVMAFEELGGAEACLQMALAYAKERYAFGRPIGSFQAIKHRLADLYAELELARSNCFYAAWALATNDASLAEAACCARLAMARVFIMCAKEMIQVHGGIGFTWDFDAHLYYRRAKHLSAALGGPMRWRERLVSLLHAKDLAAETLSHAGSGARVA